MRSHEAMSPGVMWRPTGGYRRDRGTRHHGDEAPGVRAGPGPLLGSGTRPQLTSSGQGRAVASRRLWGLVCAAVLVGPLGACHRAPVPADVTEPLCAPPAVVDVRTSARLHLDGPGAWLPGLGDSVVLVVDGLERWRGTYETCRPERVASLLPRRADSVVSVVVVRGDSARLRFGIGGARPAAVLVQTLR